MREVRSVVVQQSNRGERQRLAGRLRAEGRTYVEIAAAVRARWPEVTARAALRIAHGWTQARAARQWTRSWPDRAKQGRDFSLWEAWPHKGRRPSLADLDRLAQLYSCDIVDLLGDLPGYRDRDAAYRAAPMVSVVDRRSLLQGSLTVGAAAFVSQVADESVALAGWAEATNVGDDTITHIDDSIRAEATAYVHGEPYPLMLRTRQTRDRITRLLDGQQGWRHTRDLWVMAARSCTLLAWMSGDLGNYRAGHDQGAAAWMCAQRAEDDHSRMWARATQAKLAYWDGNYTTSASLAADGLRHTPTDSAALLLALLQARAWARLGHTKDAEDALARWRIEREKVPGPDRVGGVLGLSLAQQHYLAGSTYLWLDQPERALAEAGEAISLFEGTGPEARFYGAEMLARADAACAHLRLSELDGAAEVIDPVLSVAPEQRLDTFVQALALVRSELQQADSPRARDLVERIDDYASSAFRR